MTRRKRRTVGQRAVEAMQQATPPKADDDDPFLLLSKVSVRIGFVHGYLAGWRAAKREGKR